jgi:surface protein
MLFGCTKLTSLDLSSWNTSNVINMVSMFQSCFELKSVNLSGWNINDYVSLLAMFAGCGNLTTIYATPSWDAENVTYSNNMFQGCTKLVGGCGTTFDENHTDKEYARIDRGAAEPGYFTGVFKLTLPANVTASPNPVCTLGGVRYYATGASITLTYNGDMPEGYVPVFSVNGIPIEGNTFEMPVGDATITVTISNPPRYIYDSATGKLTLLSGEFSKDDKWGSDVPADAVTSVDATSKVIFTGNCSRLFLNFTSCTSIDLDSVNTANVTNMSNMFSGCSGLTTLNISSWNTAAVTNMNRLFNGCSSLTRLNLADWNTPNVTNMERMFSGCSNLATIYAGINWTVETVTNAGNMFSGCTSLVGGMGTTYDANHVGKEYARIDGGPDMPGYFTDPNAVVLMPGDVNGDNVVDIDDVNAIIFIILERNTISDFPGNADLDNSGTVDVDDMNTVIHIILTQ